MYIVSKIRTDIYLADWLRNTGFPTLPCPSVNSPSLQVFSPSCFPSQPATSVSLRPSPSPGLGEEEISVRLVDKCFFILCPPWGLSSPSTRRTPPWRPSSPSTRRAPAWSMSNRNSLKHFKCVLFEYSLMDSI